MADPFRIPYNNRVYLWVGVIIPFSMKMMKKAMCILPGFGKDASFCFVRKCGDPM